jgi:hypothetical protein
MSARSLFCGRPVAAVAPRCPALTLAGVAAHAGCCGGCPTRPAAPSPAPAAPAGLSKEPTR